MPYSWGIGPPILLLEVKYNTLKVLVIFCLAAGLMLTYFCSQTSVPINLIIHTRSLILLRLAFVHAHVSQ